MKRGSKLSLIRYTYLIKDFTRFLAQAIMLGLKSIAVICMFEGHALVLPRLSLQLKFHFPVTAI
jgi:hypothetical protein